MLLGDTRAERRLSTHHTNTHSSSALNEDGRAQHSRAEASIDLCCRLPQGESLEGEDEKGTIACEEGREARGERENSREGETERGQPKRGEQS